MIAKVSLFYSGSITISDTASKAGLNRITKEAAMLSEKVYILCILNILQRYSDVDHILSMKDILSKVKSEYGVKIDRRTVYRNINILIEFGYDISTYEEDRAGYFLREREFEPAELHMLADAVVSAEFIPEQNGKDLIKKLQTLGSVYQTKLLHRLVSVKTNKKAPNREIFFNVEILDQAIHEKKRVEFDYTTYGLDLNQKPRRAEKYRVSPYALYWNNGQYYLISNPDRHDGFCHFRLDRMKSIDIAEEPVKPIPQGIDVYEYAKSALYMFGGETETFMIRCDKEILNQVIDQFGDKLLITDSDEFTFTTVVKATTGGMKLWAIHYFETCEVLEPQWLLEYVTAAIKRGMLKYHLSSFK
jgi:predicted DNA-binding transcriptional regulator YafY